MEVLCCLKRVDGADVKKAETVLETAVGPSILTQLRGFQAVRTECHVSSQCCAASNNAVGGDSGQM